MTSATTDGAASAIARNQITMIGPKNFATRLVPWLCTRNRARMIARVIGSTEFSKAGVTSFSPSTAESTEMEGVMTPSP